MIPLIRKNIRLLGIGKNLLLFIGCFLFSFSSRGGTVLSFEQHLLSGTTDHYYLIFFLMPLILLSCLPLAEDDPPYDNDNTSRRQADSLPFRTPLPASAQSWENRSSNASYTRRQLPICTVPPGLRHQNVL